VRLNADVRTKKRVVGFGVARGFQRVGICTDARIGFTRWKAHAIVSRRLTESG